MRYLIVFLVSLSLLLTSFLTPSLAQRKIPPGHRKQIEGKIQQRIKKLSIAQRKNEIKVLDAKLNRVRNKFKLARLARERAIFEAEIWRIETELELLRSSVVIVAPVRPAPPPVVVVPAPPPPAPEPTPVPEVIKPRSPQFGISAGIIGSVPAARAEIKFLDPFDLVSTSIRIGAAYAEGKDSDKTLRKHALIVLDGMYHLNPPHTKGIRSYLGLGINYDAYTTGQVSGDLGASAFYGIEGGPVNGLQMFFELGYGSIRTGFSPDYTGLSALLGIKF
jgi:hypothetical protein